MIDKNQQVKKWAFMGLLLVFYCLLSAQSADLRQKRISIRAEDATVSSVLTTLSTLSGSNIVISLDQNVRDSDSEPHITVNLKDVPFEHALGSVVRMSGLSYRFIGENTYLVGSRDRVREEVGERSYIIPLNNINAEKVSKAFDSFGGKVIPIGGQNALMVYANPETYSDIVARVGEMDIPQQQIEIRARLIEVSLNDTKKLGIDWSRLNSLTTILAENPASSKGVGLPFDYFDDTGATSHGNPGALGVLPDNQYYQKIDGFNDVGHFSRQLNAFDVTLDWLLENNAAQLLTDTRITALNGEDAEIFIGEVIPFVVMDNDKQVQVEREETGIKLSVQVSLNKEGYITAVISPEVSSVTDLVGGYVPRTKTRRVNTTVTVRDGQKIHVGGLLSANLVNTTNRVPFLSAIPLLGRLFKHNYSYVQNTDLVIEITPRIINLDEQQYEYEVDERLERELIKRKTEDH